MINPSARRSFHPSSGVFQVQIPLGFLLALPFDLDFDLGLDLDLARTGAALPVGCGLFLGALAIKHPSA